MVTPDDLERFERRYGRIPRDAVVAMYSGWEARAGSVESYRNTDASGIMRFPGFGKEAVEWLLKRRRIRGIGVDTMSLDNGSSAGFDAHLTVLGADRYGVENLRNLKRLPARGATLVLGLIPWREGSGGPAGRSQASRPIGGVRRHRRAPPAASGVSRRLMRTAGAVSRER